MARHKPKIEVNKPCPTCGQQIGPTRFRNLEEERLTQAWATAAAAARDALSEAMATLKGIEGVEGDALREGLLRVDAIQRRQARLRRAEDRAWRALERHYGHKLLPEELA